MNNQEFIYWLGGFASAVGKEGPTSEQWETIVSTLNQVAEPVCVTVGDGGFGTPNTTPFVQPFHQHPFPTWQQPHYQYPSDINKVTCEDLSGVIRGSSSVGTVITNGSTGTTAKPQFSTLTTGNTTTTLPKGTTLNYTANLPEDL